MSVTLDLKTLIWIIIAVAVLILVIYFIRLVRKLIITVDSTNKILSDVNDISEIASKRSKDVDDVLEGVVEAVSSLQGKKTSLVAAVVSFIKSVFTLKDSMKNRS